MITFSPLNNLVVVIVVLLTNRLLRLPYPLAPMATLFVNIQHSRSDHRSRRRNRSAFNLLSLVVQIPMAKVSDCQ